MGNIQGTQECGQCHRFLVGGGMKRKGQPGAGVEEGGGRHCGCILRAQEAPLVPGAPPLPWAPRIPSLVLPLAPVAAFAPLVFPRQVFKQDNVQGLTPNNHA